MSAVLSIDALAKSYGPVQALRGVSFSVPQGSVFGILGPNGSGKTTLLAIVLDVLQADAGSYSWLGGVGSSQARQQIGSLLETPNFYHYMSAWDNLEIAASIKGRGLEDRTRVLELTGLLPRKDSAFKTYSLGMKQRLAIASALLGRPKVLVLDEPTNGLDPAGIAEIRTLIRRLAAEGITIIMASHLLDEVEKVCDHVAILKKGTLLLTGKVEDVMRSDNAVEVAVENSADGLEATLRALSGVRDVRRVDSRWILTVDETATPAAINRALSAQGITLSHLALKRKSLESMFMELTEDTSGAARN
jgi:ABC-2 type transport system ATP-binding protein